MSINRGDVVLLDYPYVAGGSKVRPALVVQNDRDNLRLTNMSFRSLRETAISLGDRSRA